MRIRAAVLERFGAPLVVQDVDLAGPGAGEVLVRVPACGVCHTDLYTLDEVIDAFALMDAQDGIRSGITFG